MRGSTRLIINSGIRLCLVLLLAGLTGCADFFAEKPTEVQSENILRDLSRIRVLPDPNVIEPEIYIQPPSIIREGNDVKLFYFVRNQTVPEMATLLTQQYSFLVSQVLPTNQLIVKCKTPAEANSVLAFLREVDVPPIQVRIDCIVSELYADTTMDWETTLLITNLFGEGIVVGGKTDASGNVLPAFPGASIRDTNRSSMGLRVGIKRDNFLALIDMLVSRGYLKIMMSPSLEIINGKTARIETVSKVPQQKEVTTTPGVLPYNITEYVDVIDSLLVTPHVFADGYIGLETKCVTGSKSTPEGVAQIPIITKREIENKENRIRQGESLIIGGIKKTEKRSVVRGVPFLKDLPLIGILFSSKDFEERGTEVIFILTPTISAGGIPQAKMVADLIKKHNPAESKPTLTESVFDPFGLQAKEEQRKQAAELAEDGRVNADRAKMRAEQAEAEAKKLKFAAEQSGIEKGKAEQLKAQAIAAQAEAQKARAAAEQAQAEAQKAAAEAEKAKKEAEAALSQKAAAEAQKAAAEASRVKAEAEKAANEAAKVASQSQEATAKAAAEKAQAEAEIAKSKAQVEGAKAVAAKAEAERAKAEVEKAKVEVDRAVLDAKKANAPNNHEPNTGNGNASEQAAPVPAKPVQPEPSSAPSQPPAATPAPATKESAEPNTAATQ
ncbi:MAG: type II and III secretion system protein [Sedimentisphaerales bacterium]|nr:type II and III secretion system protein [Sedimentisphaerales bacterium]